MNGYRSGRAGGSRGRAAVGQGPEQGAPGKRSLVDTVYRQADGRQLGGGTPSARVGHSGGDGGGGAPSSTQSTLEDAVGGQMCTPEEAQSRADETLQSIQSQIDQCVSEPIPPPAQGGVACTVDLTSRPLNEALSELMRAEGMTPPQISAVWTEVQRRVAASYGELYDASGRVQRSVASLLEGLLVRDLHG